MKFLETVLVTCVVVVAVHLVAKALKFQSPGEDSVGSTEKGLQTVLPPNFDLPNA